MNTSSSPVLVYHALARQPEIRAQQLFHRLSIFPSNAHSDGATKATQILFSQTTSSTATHWFSPLISITQQKLFHSPKFETRKMFTSGIDSIVTPKNLRNRSDVNGAASVACGAASVRLCAFVTFRFLSIHQSHSLVSLLLVARAHAGCVFWMSFCATFHVSDVYVVSLLARTIDVCCVSRSVAVLSTV